MTDLAPRPEQRLTTRIHAAALHDLLPLDLVTIGTGCRISPHALFDPQDEQGTLRPIHIHDRVTIGAGAIIHGGTHLHDDTRIEDHTIVGKPEHGYAVGRTYPGAGTDTHIRPGAVIRSGAVVYAGASVGTNTCIGHHTLVRSHTRIGADGVFGHHLVLERACIIGDRVRCSPLSHITSESFLGDGVFLGAGLRTVNDKYLIWRDPTRDPDLQPPRFETGAKVGSGSTILAGITIGAHALVGAGSLVTRDIPPGATAYGSPARVHPATTV